MRPEKLFSLFSPIETLSGIGKKTAVLCEKLEITKTVDLLFHLPTGYIDRRLKSDIVSLADSQYATLKVTPVKHLPPFSKKSPHKVLCTDSNGDTLNVVFFHSLDRKSVV